MPRREYDDAHPDEAFLIVEVADRSVRKDRLVKAGLYAKSGVPEYWIVNVAERAIEVHTSPSDDGYRSVASHGPGERVRLVVFPDVEVAVDEILK